MSSRHDAAIRRIVGGKPLETMQFRRAKWAVWWRSRPRRQLSCREATKARIFTSVREFSGLGRIVSCLQISDGRRYPMLCATCRRAVLNERTTFNCKREGLL
jgi:hypothetical protein